MRKGYSKLMLFDIILAIILLLSSFMLSILNNYYQMIIFLIVVTIIFRFMFGYEKDNHRYIKDIMLDLLIVILIFFIAYYVFGIFIGFVRTENYYNWYGFKTFIFPYILLIILKEHLRYQMVSRTGDSKLTLAVVCILFMILDVSLNSTRANFSDSYSIFVFIAVTLLPIISSNIVCTYIAKKVGYKPNVFWYLFANAYSLFLPFVPNTGLYLGSLIKFLFPTVIAYRSYSFFKTRSKSAPVSYVSKKTDFIGLSLLAVVTFVLAYFVSGYFRYYVVAVATGSMTPNINVGDAVVIDQYADYQDLEVGEIIAYRYDDKIVVHRLVNVVIVGSDYYFYSKGDANNEQDNYIIYPDTILGPVKFRLPFVGVPTVWLNSL